MTIVIANTKGGVAKTTMAVHMAAVLGAQHRTLLVDADPQGSALSWAEEIEDYPAVAVGRGRSRGLARDLRSLARDFDYVVVDTPGSRESGIAGQAMSAADLVLVPIAPTAADFADMPKTIELIDDAVVAAPPRVLAVLTRVRPGTRSRSDARAALIEHGLEVATTELPLRESIAGAYGGPLAEPALWEALIQEITRIKVAA